MNIALIGPSGGGKGTHIPRLVAEFQLAHLSTGDLFRENLQSETPLGLKAKNYIAEGELVPDDLVDAMIEERLRAVPADAGVLFDGFPRTVSQAKFLERIFSESGRELASLIYLHIPDHEALNRLSARVICRKCNIPFHKVVNPFQTCPLEECNGEHLMHRPDDRPELIRERVKNFHRATGPLVQLYQQKGKLIVISGEQPIDRVQEDLVEAVQSIRLQRAIFASEAETNLIRIGPPSVLPAASRTISLKTLDLVLLGGPGSGKGTQAEQLCSRFDLHHIATGDLFRTHLKNDTSLGELARTYMNRGELVPDDVTDAMVRERLKEDGQQNGFVLDGFPRSLHQAEALAEMLSERDRRLSAVLYVNVSDDEIVERLAGRLVCRSCQAPYHLRFHSPANPGVCDKCAGELYHRDDDRPETIRARLKTFHERTEPLIEFYKNEGLLIEVNGENSIEKVTQDAIAVIEPLSRGFPKTVTLNNSR